MRLTWQHFSPPMKYSGIFLFKVILFGLIYWGIFSIAPDSFRFASGYNVEPLTRYWETFFEQEDPSKIAENDISSDIELFRLSANQLTEAYNRWASAEMVRQLAEQRYEDLMTRMSDSVESASREYSEKFITPLNKKIEEIEFILLNDELEGNVRMQLLEDMQKLNREAITHLDYIIHDRRGFIPDSLIQEEARASEDLSRSSENAKIANEEYREMRSNLVEQYQQTRSAAIEKVGFLDFIYFSACVSTTALFGDIVANKLYLKIIVIVQIFLGITILFFLLDELSKSKQRQ